MNPSVSGQARSARVLVAITFHFVADRVRFLAEVLRALSEFPVSAMDVVIVTNTFNEEHLARVRRLCAEILVEKNPYVRSYANLSHPHALAWCHKSIIATEFADGNHGRYTHFIYLEDDIRLSFENFCYFVEWREQLSDSGLLPAFVRTEYSTALNGLVASDAFWPVYVPFQSHIRFGETVMVNMPNPYNPCFILDAELAAEYVRTRSFDRTTSNEVCRWGMREKAAMGLCLENVPPPFQSRYVVPVSATTDTVPSIARISHLPNNYADDPNMSLGKVRIDSLFKGARALANGDWWPSPRRGGRDGIAARQEAEATSPISGEPQTILGERYYLITHHDTVLYVDEPERQLRSGPFGVVPSNLVLEVAGSRGQFIALHDSSPEFRILSFALDKAGLCLLSDSGVSSFQIETVREDVVGLRAGDLYLGADWDGGVRYKIRCQAFEQFRLMRADTFDGLAVIQRHSWISDDDRQVVTLLPQPVDFGHNIPPEWSAIAATLGDGALGLRRCLTFGPARIRLVGKMPQIALNTTSGADHDDPSIVFITDIAGARYRFSRLPS